MPLPINTSSLVDEMRQNLAEINAQIQTIKDGIHDKMERNQIFVETAYQAVYADGHYMLADLLVAKASLLAAIANLQAANTRSR